MFLLTSACGARVVVEEGSPITPIPEEAYCTTAAKASCPLLVDCCHAVKFDADVTACEKNYVKSCEEDRRAKVAAGRTYDAKAASSCLSAKIRYSKGCAVAMVPYHSMDDELWAAVKACSQVWQGATALGGACSADSECAGAEPGVQVGCYIAPPASSGVCRTRRRLAEGEGCADGLDFCGGGLVCAPSGTGTRRCVRRGALGESCSPFAWPSCVDGLTCDPTTNTCAPPRPVGAACVAPMILSTAPDSTCVAPAECDSVRRVCVEPKPTGAACSSSSSAIELRCKRSDYCEPATGTCVSRKLDGEPCTVSHECRGWRCSAGRCVPNGAIADADSCKLAK